MLNTSPLSYLDLDESKIKTYVAVLELGTARAQEIADKAGMKRTTVYDNIEKLEKLGLLSAKTKGRTTIYSPADPRKLGVIMERRAEEVRSIIPDLSALFEAADRFRPNVRFFEGTEGFKQVMEEVFQDNRERFYRSLNTPNLLQEVIGGETYIDTFTKRRLRLGITQQSLRPHESRIESQSHDTSLHGNGKKWLREIRYLPKGTEIKSTLVIWDNKVGIISTKGEGYSLLIESKDYAETMKNMYDLAWSVSSRDERMN